jgi:hypothetical protein
MKNDYSSWPRGRLIAEILRLTVQNVTLTEGLHQACQEGTSAMIRNVQLERRLKAQQKFRNFLHG